jgi:hypothetical protein
MEGFTGFATLMKPELAAVFSAFIAVGAAGLNLYGGLLTEGRRVDLQREVSCGAGRPCRACSCPVQLLAARPPSSPEPFPLGPRAGGPREELPGAAAGAAVHHRALQVCARSRAAPFPPLAPPARRRRPLPPPPKRPISMQAPPRLTSPLCTAPSAARAPPPPPPPAGARCWRRPSTWSSASTTSSP